MTICAADGMVVPLSDGDSAALTACDDQRRPATQNA